ncbi:helix-turn-helix domain-containing protein, partial [Escherichia coli]
MAKPKYSLETSNHYLAGHNGARRIAERFGVEETSVRRWVRARQL